MSMTGDTPIHPFPDRAIRQSLVYPDHLRSFLRQAVPDIADRFVCEQARLLDREFATDDWRKRESDLLFEIPFRANDGVRLLLVCVLIEHQSEPDPLMPLRTLLYAVFFWERQWKDWEKAAPPKTALRLMPVVPLVLHTGPRRWGSNREFADLFDAPDAVRAFAPKWQPLFWDLADHTPKELIDAGEVWLNLMAVVRSENDAEGEFGPVFIEALRAINPLYNTDRTRWYDMLRTVITWAAWRRPGPEKQKWLETAKAHQPTPAQQTEVSTMAQTIRESWLEEGATHQMQRMILRLGRKRLGDPRPTEEAAIIRIADLKALESMMVQLESVETWAELIPMS